MRDFTLPDTRLPALEPLINGTLWKDWADAGRVFPLDNVRDAIGYIRLKPSDSCRLTLLSSREGKGEEPPAGYLLRLYPDAERARSAFEKIRTRHQIIGSDGYEPFMSESPPLVATPFPNDLELPHLRHIYEPDRFRRSLQLTLPAEYPGDQWRIQRRHMRTKLLAYKPGRRAVFRVRVKLRNKDRDEKVRCYWHLKVCTPSFAERSHQNHTRLFEAIDPGTFWRVPAPRGLVAENSVVACEWVRGQPLEEDLAGGNGECGDTIEQLGGAVAEFHQTEIQLPHLPSPPQEMDELMALAADLSALLPGLAKRFHGAGERIAQGLMQLSTCTSSIVHGDLHPGQVLRHEGRIVLVDLDEAGRGYGVNDVGSFLAGLHERDLVEKYAEPFLDGYQSKAGALQADLTDISTAAHLFRRLVFPFRTLNPEWPQETERLLDRVEKLAMGVRS